VIKNELNTYITMIYVIAIFFVLCTYLMMQPLGGDRHLKETGPSGILAQICVSFCQPGLLGVQHEEIYYAFFSHLDLDSGW